ncbi:pyrimidine-specific ribonucleoside hydrolase [Dyadobacter jejuensis]|uniref:Pyrimidine-specific ribonucleoside hydrolase n=1 Tax=Dyadobacter jejuensis TaxID=1082580 RepID=A0A316AI78_9BACT|nr:pyrimidine-specific ribonucleoside hydrolase RihA [Dyadobacter jejuensis]PWJ57422.1 pyrimidine-specific ribonucleoside hydrolase [Dyadobacter jejuensis]
MDKIPIIIDCDPGHDDALMLMLAFGSGRFDVKAVSTSAGNQTQDKTLGNALKLLTLIGQRVPVFRGAEKPLHRELIIADYVHGETGLDGPELPVPTFEQESTPAAEGIAHILEASSEPITIVPTGPLTNIALLLSTYPHLKHKIKRISLMGGGIFRGNMTPLAEFNIYADPEAAAIVFESGVPITMCGLDVTHKALVYAEDIARFRAIGNQTGTVAAGLLDFFSKFYRENRTELHGGAALHDPCAIAWLMDPEMFQSKSCYVRVETQGAYTTGATVVDFYRVLAQKPNVEVVYDLNRERYIDLLATSIAALP